MRPNEYERSEFFSARALAILRPESIDTHEVVWERYTNDWLRTSLSAYWYQADGLITLHSGPVDVPGNDVRQRRACSGQWPRD